MEEDMRAVCAQSAGEQQQQQQEQGEEEKEEKDALLVSLIEHQ
jgi:hypothetical protein